MTEEKKDDAGQVFGTYSGFYDALYEDKDYDAECDFLELVFGEYGSGRVGTVLDLGCGTGGHDIPLARRGYEMVGVDRAPGMVEQARAKAATEGLTPEFVVGDVCGVDLGRTFDAVISMFAVVSYQTTNDDLAHMMRVARRHLNGGGLFVFDGWFGPGVLAQRPEHKSKAIELEGGEQIVRSATPSLDLMAHTVRVDYEVQRKRGGEVLESSEESHTVRFLFPQEITQFLSISGFELAAIGPLMDLDRALTEDDWNFSVVARAMAAN